MIQRATIPIVSSLFLCGCTDGNPEPARDPGAETAPAPGPSHDASAAADPDDECSTWGNWRLDYGPFTADGLVCSEPPTDDGLRISVVRAPEGVSSGEKIRWAEGCTGRRWIAAHLGCKLELTCEVVDAVFNESWSSTRTLSLTFARGSTTATGEVRIKNGGFCTGKMSAPVTARRLP